MTIAQAQTRKANHYSKNHEATSDNREADLHLETNVLIFKSLDRFITLCHTTSWWSTRHLLIHKNIVKILLLLIRGRESW